MFEDREDMFKAFDYNPVLKHHSHVAALSAEASL